MSTTTSLPFFSLSTDAQHQIFEKMDNVQVIRMSQTCSETKKFVQFHQKRISSRTHSGFSFRLITDKGKLLLQKGNGENLLEIDSNFVNLDGIAISTLVICFWDSSLIGNAIEALKKWTPVCSSVEILSAGPVSTYQEIAKYITCTGHIGFSGIDGKDEQLMETLEKTENPTNFEITVRGEQIRNDIFEKLKNFHTIWIQSNIDSIWKFIQDLSEATDIGKFVRAAFLHRPSLTSVTVDSFSRIDSFLLDTMDIRTTLLFKNKCKRIKKLYLGQQQCAVIQERNEGSDKYVDINMMKDDDDVVLDFLQKSLFRGAITFSQENRKRYIEKNEEERAAEIEAAYVAAPKIPRGYRRR